MQVILEYLYLWAIVKKIVLRKFRFIFELILGMCRSIRRKDLDNNKQNCFINIYNLPLRPVVKR